MKSWRLEVGSWKYNIRCGFAAEAHYATLTAPPLEAAVHPVLSNTLHRSHAMRIAFCRCIRQRHAFATKRCLTHTLSVNPPLRRRGSKRGLKNLLREAQLFLHFQLHFSSSPRLRRRFGSGRLRRSLMVVRWRPLPVRTRTVPKRLASVSCTLPAGEAVGAA